MLKLIFLLLFPFTISAQLIRFHFTENKMGSPFNIIFYHQDSLDAGRIAEECFRIADLLNDIFSDYSDESEIGKLKIYEPGKIYPVSPGLFNMIRQSKKLWRRSGKTFDITMGALTRLWREAKNQDRILSPEQINTARKQSGFKQIRMLRKRKSVSFKSPGVSFDFGGIVKGYTAQMMILYLATKNIKSALVDAGGDIVIHDPPPGKIGWSIGINMPGHHDELWEQQIELNNSAVATSGDLYRFTIHQGKKYSHIIDPRTGYGVTSQRNVTVIAKNGTTADWLATACSILPIKKAMRLAKKENAELFIATVQDEKIITYQSSNFKRYFQKNLP